MDDKEEDKKEEEAKVVEDDQVQGRQAESQAEIYKIDLDHASKVLSMQEDETAEVQEVVDVVTTAKLITKVVTAARQHKHQVLLEEDLMESQQLVVELGDEVVVVAEVILVECVVPGMLMEDLEVAVVVE
nr:hypothetical protein [Tanacetum cinerariifolium]